MGWQTAVFTGPALIYQRLYLSIDTVEKQHRYAQSLAVIQAH